MREKEKERYKKLESVKVTPEINKNQEVEGHSIMLIEIEMQKLLQNSETNVL